MMSLGNAEQAGQWLDRHLTKPLFLLSITFLLVLGGLAHRFPKEHATEFEKEAMALALLAAWPVFCCEAVLRFRLRDRSRGWFRSLVYPFWIVLFPPSRLAGWSYRDARRLWLPGWGWQDVSKELHERLTRLFSIPMIILALLVLPILTVQYFWEDLVQRELTLNVALDVGSTLIWVAFVVEFTLMVAVAECKSRYARNHWLELLIIVLPVVDYLPLLRALRLLRLIRPVLIYYARYYRLYGLLMKVWQYLVFWNLFARIRRRIWPLDPRKELNQLRALLREKEQEHEAIAAQVSELKRRIVQAERRVEEQLRSTSAIEYGSPSPDHDEADTDRQ
jgi:hypothetical protein